MPQLRSRGSFLPILVFSAAVISATPVAASGTKDQAFEPASPDTIPTIFSNYRWAQTFTVGASGTLTRVDVLVAQLFNVQPDDLEITIFDTSAGAPRAAVTAPFHISPGSVPIVPHPSNFGSYAYVSADVMLPVTAGDVLAIVVSTGPRSQYYWAGVFGGGYPRGQLYQTTGSVWSSAAPEDQVFRTFVVPSRPPTANAGINQTVRSATITLDGSGSFDDNTATNNLLYEWSFVSVPDGSALTALTGATTIAPSFVADVAGDYVVQLIVTDEDGLSSPPSQVTIGRNLPPVSIAGPDQIVMVNQPVVLSGGAVDPDGDGITYSWTLTTKPAGSNAQFLWTNLPDTFLFPDLPGVYVATVTPSDFIGSGTSASTTITATTGETYAELQLQAAAALIRGLPASAVTNGGNQNALIQLLSNASTAIQRGELDRARHHIEDAISRTDGCKLQGSPDGNRIGRDWITTCDAQLPLYDLLIVAFFAIAP